MRKYGEPNVAKYVWIAIIILVVSGFFTLIISNIKSDIDNKKEIAEAEQLIKQIDAEHEAFLNKHCSVLEYDFAGNPYKYSCYGTIFTNK